MAPPILEAFGINPTDPDVVAVQQDFNNYANLITDLVAHRKRMGLTKQDVAKRMGTTPKKVGNLESSTSNPTVQQLQQYARALNTQLVLNHTNPNKPTPQELQHWAQLANQKQWPTPTQIGELRQALKTLLNHHQPTHTEQWAALANSQTRWPRQHELGELRHAIKTLTTQTGRTQP